MAELRRSGVISGVDPQNKGRRPASEEENEDKQFTKYPDPFDKLAK
jgi:hypothetical protein